jgi:hypothetical protein
VNQTIVPEHIEADGCNPLKEMHNMSAKPGYSLERMNCYRNGASEAANLALPCEDAELRDAYLIIAKTWTELADKIERKRRARRPRTS